MKTDRFILGFLVFFLSYNAYSQPHIKWWYDTKDASYGQSTAADLDGDGKMEIVFGCYRNDSSVYALNADSGTLLWKYNAHPPGVEGCNDAAPLIYDVDGDGMPEVFVASSCNPVTFCFDGSTGVVRWQCPMRGSDSPPAIADLDNDGDLEIIHGEFEGYVICIDADSGFVEWEIAVDTDSWIQTAPTIVDLDNDGQLDFVVGTWNNVTTDSNKVYAFRGDNQNLIWSYPIRDYMYHGTAVSDLDNDGLPELVIGAYNDTLFCINGDNGTTSWKYKATGGYIGPPASLGDIDNDGSCDVIFVSSYQVTALNSDGTFKWKYNIPSFDQSFRGAALSDINGDSFLDVIFGTTGGVVIALNGNDGSLIWSIDLAFDYGNVNFELDHAPLVADFDGDDSLDVFIVGGYGSYPNFQVDFGRAYMLTAGKGNGPDWLTFQNNHLRQSSLCMDSTTQVKNISELNNDIDIFPNPSNHTVNIRVSNSQNHSTITVFNIHGGVQKVLEMHEPKFTLDVSTWQPGIYFVMISDGQSRFGKLIVR